jgi:hypothetical protein
MHGPRYRVSENRVVVSNVADGEDIYEIEITPGPATIVVRVGARVVFSTVTGHVATGMVGGAGIRYVVPLGVSADTTRGFDGRRPRA